MTSRRDRESPELDNHEGSLGVPDSVAGADGTQAKPPNELDDRMARIWARLFEEHERKSGREAGIGPGGEDGPAGRSY